MLVIIYGPQWILNCQFLFNIYFALVHFWWLFPSLASVLVLFKLTFIPSSHNVFLNYANVLYHDKLSLKQSAFLKTNNFVDMLKVEWGQYPWLLPMLPRKLELILSQVQRYSCLNHFSSFHISPSSLYWMEIILWCFILMSYLIVEKKNWKKENLDYVHIFKILSRMDWYMYVHLNLSQLHDMVLVFVMLNCYVLVKLISPCTVPIWSKRHGNWLLSRKSPYQYHLVCGEFPFPI